MLTITGFTSPTIIYGLNLEAPKDAEWVKCEHHWPKNYPSRFSNWLNPSSPVHPVTNCFIRLTMWFLQLSAIKSSQTMTGGYTVYTPHVNLSWGWLLWQVFHVRQSHQFINHSRFQRILTGGMVTIPSRLGGFNHCWNTTVSQYRHISMSHVSQIVVNIIPRIFPESRGTPKSSSVWMEFSMTMQPAIYTRYCSPQLQRLLDAQSIR